VPLFAAFMRPSAAYGDCGMDPMRLFSIFVAMPIAASHFTRRSTLPGSFCRFTLMRPETTSSVQRIESSRKLTDGKIASAMPSSNASWPLSVRFCFSGFSMTTLRAFSMPMRLGRIVAPPQPGMRPRNTSGSASAGAEASTVR
jgi:hypothetical protein